MRGDSDELGEEGRWTAAASRFRRYRHANKRDETGEMGNRRLWHQSGSRFTTEAKAFELCMLGGRRKLRIVEFSIHMRFTLEVEWDDVSWLVSNVRQAINAPRDGSFRQTQRMVLSVMMLETYSNSRGVMLKVSKIFNGRCFFVIVPEGPKGRAWEDFNRCLGQASGEPIVEGTGNQKEEETPALRAVNPWGRTERNTELPAIILFRSSDSLAWEDIEDELSARFYQNIKTYPIGDDRAIVWCQNTQEMNMIS